MSETDPQIIEERTEEDPPAPEAVVDAEIVPSDGAEEAAALGIDLPEDKDEAIAVLLQSLEEARTEAGSYIDDLRRVAADFDNYRKRTAREQSVILDRAAERVVRELLPVLDTFDAAVAVDPSTDPERQLLSGLLNTRQQLLKALEKEGLAVIETVGAEFDPEVHEPVGAPEGQGTLVVAQELRRGYTLNSKLLRAALVLLETSQ